MKTGEMRAVGYCRVSMREQLEGHSLEAQESNIREYAERQGWHLAQIYVEAGVSAKPGSNRPILERLMGDAQAGRFDVVVVDKVDRFYRHLQGLLAALEKLRAWGVSFASVQEQLDFTTPWGKLTLTVLGILAEIYIDNLRQETRKGLHQRAKEGLWNGSIPFGYCKGLCSRCDDPNGAGYCPEYGQADKSDGLRLILHPIEHLGVKKAFALYQTRKYSDAMIADELNRMVVTLPDGRTVKLRQKGHRGRSRPGAFSRDVVRDMLKRVFYTGKVPYYGRRADGKSRKRDKPQALYPGRHPAIVDEETFQQVQELRKAVAWVPRGRGPQVRVYPLTGILRCGYCGGTMRGSSTNGRRYYRDATKIEHKGACPQGLVREAEIERQVVEILRAMLAAAGVTTDEEAKQAAAAARWQRAQELYLLGEIGRERYQAERVRYEKQKTPLRKTTSGARIPYRSEYAHLLEDAVWDRTLPEKKKRLLQLALEAVFVRGNAVVGVQPTFAFHPVPQNGAPGCNSGDDGPISY